jgi:hypothetical protein
MDILVVTLVVFGALGLLFAASRNATTLCLLEISNGAATVARGSLPSGLLSDVRDVVRRPAVGHASVRIVRRAGRAEVVATGDLSDAQKQQLRNIIGRVPLAKLMSGGERRTAG